MSLIELTIDDVRCIQHAQFSLHPRHNLIWGDNGSGKTSLLEAMFLLGRGRSFRTRNSERLIRLGQQRLVVFGRTAGSIPHALGVQVVKSAGTTARIDGNAAGSLTELSQAFPVQVIDPGVHKLIEEGGHRRRRWMDWTVFHVEHGFAEQWVRYTRAVKQRNAALRSQPAHATAWDPELARLGESIAEARRRVLERLQPAWLDSVGALGNFPVQLHYSRGWNQDVSLADALRDGLARDLARGITHSGPHRADVLVRMGARPAREVLSRGQQKLVAIAMLLAQVRLVTEISDIPPTLLLDDPAAELDIVHLQRFIELVRQLGCQLILTSLQAPGGPDLEGPFGRPDKVFHVEQGGVSPV
jgi:DNA replication and repair protein RecF